MTVNSKWPGWRIFAALQLRRSECLCLVAAIVTKAACFSLLAVSFTPRLSDAARNSVQSYNMTLAAQSITRPHPVVERTPEKADFKGEHPSLEARHLADWVVDSGDNRSMSFVIVDKVNAKVFVFGSDGRLRGAAPALLGLARGDDAIPGIGDRKLSSIRPEERTTPAGRFVSALGRNLHGDEILWIDYDAAISMHSVITTISRESRLQRLATPSPLDNRISYGCINVPKKFYNKIVRPAFTGTNGIVYILPETRTAREVFGSCDVEKLNNSHPETVRTLQPFSR